MGVLAGFPGRGDSSSRRQGRIPMPCCSPPCDRNPGKRAIEPLLRLHFGPMCGSVDSLKVQEYWILDPNNRSIEVYALTEAGYDIAGFAVEQGTASSGVLQGFSVTVQEIMP